MSGGGGGGGSGSGGDENHTPISAFPNKLYLQ